MGWQEATLFLVPPLLAIGLSFLVHSQVARWLLRIGGAYFAVTLSLYVFMLIDCRWDKMSAYACNTLPESLEISLSIFNLINVVTYLHVAPFLALWALLVEGVKANCQQSMTRALKTTIAACSAWDSAPSHL